MILSTTNSLHGIVKVTLMKCQPKDDCTTSK